MDPNEATWNEHGHYTPDGRHIVWMSSRGDHDQQDYSGDTYTESFGTLKTDYWVMNSDGSDKRRLTFFGSEREFDEVPIWRGVREFGSPTEVGRLSDADLSGANRVVGVEAKSARNGSPTFPRFWTRWSRAESPSFCIG